jgi:hypothetical protein
MSEVKQKAKGTAKTEAIIGAASNKIVTATKSLNDAVATALKLTETLDENALKIADQEEKLANLQTEYQNKRTQQHIDLDLAYKADQKQFADQYLGANGLVAVEKDEYVALQQEVEDLKQNFAEKVKAEIGKAEGIANSKAKAAEELAQAKYEAKEAGNLAEIKNLQAQLNFANQQIQVWKTQLDEERKAGVERAKAGAVGTISVTGTGK